MNEHPWLVKAATAFVEQRIKPEHDVLETGAGGSTLWFAKRAGSVLSYEHDIAWHKGVRENIEKAQIKNVTLRYEIEYPINGILGIKEKFDFILIDGRGRVQSTKTTIGYLKQGGYFILDNSERERYREALALLDSLGWKRWDFSEAWRTSIWKK